MSILNQPAALDASRVFVRPLERRDLDAADRVYRLAFGTFIGLPQPELFAGDTDFIRTRWVVDPTAALCAEIDGNLVGSNFLTRWGSVGFFGPLTVHPEFWDRGVAKKLLAPTVEIFRSWQVTHAGLYTFSQSAKHIALYQQFGFWPRFLTMIMSKPVSARSTAAPLLRFSEIRPEGKASMLKECAAVTDSVYPGMEVTREILAVDEQRLGDTILLICDSQLTGLAVCHCGAGTEAGSGACYVKFAVARAGQSAERQFERLVDACEDFAAAQGASRLIAGVNTSRAQAYRLLLQKGFRIDLQGVVMEWNNAPGYNREGVYLIDDWR